jgi:hypothetical protein
LDDFDGSIGGGGVVDFGVRASHEPVSRLYDFAGL